MIRPDLKSPEEAEIEIASVFLQEISNSGNEFLISCRDESAFVEDKWINLGTIRFALVSNNENLDETDLSSLIKLGAFEWSTPNVDNTRRELSEVLGFNSSEQENSDIDSVLRDITSIAVRTGLIMPAFDAAALGDMPYNRSTTIVSDTSGVLQGGLNFVTKYLYPAARIKIPSIVNMELIGSADNFFILRRHKKKKNSNRRKRELVEHLKSQGGQRVLLKLELQSDTEIERTFLLGDPLRDAFKTDNETDIAGLNISRPIKSYADRLILEAARRHQAQSGPSHEVRLLTSDQGLAKMALAEGMATLYFYANRALKFFDARLTGRTFHPFNGRIQSISLADVLWEFATAFGSVKIESKDRKCKFTVSALGKELSWSPYHSLDDLLWCSSEKPKVGLGLSNNKTNLMYTDVDSSTLENSSKPIKQSSDESKVTFFRFNVESLFKFVCILDDVQEMETDKVFEKLRLMSRRVLDEYKRFLLSAELISIKDRVWIAKPNLGRLSSALRNERTEEVHEILLAAPSYRKFAKDINLLEISQILDKQSYKRGTNTYRTLGEITRICAEIRGEGIYSTPNKPEAVDFAKIALERFRELEEEDGLVATGSWLEALIRKNGIHPEIAQRRLDQASKDGIINRSTEGSTTQIRNDDHILHVLKTREGMPWINTVHLYRGDFLIPGKASVSLRIREV